MKPAIQTDQYSLYCGDAIKFLKSQPDDSIDLLFTSPPYELARTYGIGDKMLGGEKWVEWMFKVIEAAAPKVKGLIAMNCEGQTRDYRYSMTPFLLMADLHRAGFNLRKPAVFHRIGIPGSGGPDWLRNDWEPIICVTRPGQLPWSDNTACGHPPKWAPGGEMSHRLSDGTRRTQWGSNPNGGTAHRTKDGTRKASSRPSHTNYTKAEKVAMGAKLHTKRDGDEQGNGDAMREQAYLPPAIANPGNKIEAKYTASEVAKMLDGQHDLLSIKVGGGLMGHVLSHENEAAFPLELPTFFVKSFCPPGGVVCDPFFGSGTTLQAAHENGRRFVGCDLRKSQVELSVRRIKTVTPDMFAAS